MRRSARSASRRRRDQLLGRVGVHLQRRLDLLRRDALLELGGGRAGAAQARGEAVDQPGDVLALADQPLADPQRGGGVAFEQRVGERPDGGLGGVGDHRFEVGGADLAPVARPEREPLELVAQPHRVGAHAVDQDPGGGGLEAEAEPLGVGDQQCAASRAPSAPRTRGSRPRAALTALTSFAGALPRAIRTRVRSGGSAPIAATTALQLAIAPALDPVGQQVAPRVHQRHRRDRRQQRLVVGHALALAGLEDLQRLAPPSRSARARSRPGWRRFRPVGAGDQVQRCISSASGRVYRRVRSTSRGRGRALAAAAAGVDSSASASRRRRRGGGGAARAKPRRRSPPALRPHGAEIRSPRRRFASESRGAACETRPVARPSLGVSAAARDGLGCGSEVGAGAGLESPAAAARRRRRAGRRRARVAGAGAVPERGRGRRGLRVGWGGRGYLAGSGRSARARTAPGAAVASSGSASRARSDRPADRSGMTGSSRPRVVPTLRHRRAGDRQRRQNGKPCCEQRDQDQAERRGDTEQREDGAAHPLHRPFPQGSTAPIRTGAVALRRASGRKHRPQVGANRFEPENPLSIRPFVEFFQSVCVTRIEPRPTSIAIRRRGRCAASRTPCAARVASVPAVGWP